MSTTRVSPSQLSDKSIFDFTRFEKKESKNNDEEPSVKEILKKPTITLDAEKEIRPLWMKVVPWKTPF